MVLTQKEIGALNNKMLQRGVPVERDNMGYNQADFVTCNRITSSEPSKEECYTIVKALFKYAKTQLGMDKGVLQESIDYYKSYEKGKHVYVVEQDNIGAWCKWSYNAELVSGLKQINKDFYKWVKVGNEYKCRLAYQAFDVFFNLFDGLGIDCSELKAVVIPEQTAEAIKEPTADLTKVYELQVRRIDIDYLGIKFDYCEELVQAIKKIPTAYFNKRNTEWEVDLLYATDLYKALRGAKTKVNLKPLKSWALQMFFNSDYKFTTDLSRVSFKPRDYQINDAKLMLEKKTYINANEMGVGKTFECVIAGESLPFPKLVICPASLRINWRKEIKMVNPDADVVILQSADEFKIGKDWTIVAYSSLDKHKDNLEKQYFKAVFADEAHFIKAVKNSGAPDSIRAEVALRISKTAEYVYPVTGTPKTNRNKDLFNLLRMVRHPLVQGKWAFSNYGKTFCDGHNNGWGWDYEGSSNDKILHEKLQPIMIRHLKSEVLPHIQKVRNFMPVQVDLREYNREINEYLNSRKSSQAVQLAKLTRAKLVLANKKAKESVEFAKNLILQGKKVLIVTCFTEVVKQVESAFKGNCVKIVGGMSDIAKDKAVTEFQTGDAMVCVMNIIAGGVGLTLTASHNVIMNDFDWVPGNMIQAEDRCARSGQEYLTNVTYMYAEGADMDELLAEVLTEKFDTINAAIDGGDGESVNLKGMIEEMLEQKRLGKVIKAKDLKSTRVIPAKTSEKPIQVTNQSDQVTKELEQKIQPKKVNKEQHDFKAMTEEQLINLAEELKVTWKQCEHKGINRMRITMAIKKAL